MRRQAVWLAVAGAFGLLGLSSIAAYVMSMPTTLQVAVGPLNSDNYRMMAVLAQLLAREKADIRLRLVQTDGSEASFTALQSGAADLIVLRSDIGVPTNGLGVVEMRRELVVLMVDPKRGIHGISDLRGQTVGIVAAPALNTALIQKLLTYYGSMADEVKLRLLTPDNSATALAKGDVAAIMTVGSPTSRQIVGLDASVARALGTPPHYLSISEAPAIAQRSPQLEVAQLVRGVFGGAPPHPPESLVTIAVIHQLIANKTIDESIISSLTQHIFAQRVALSNEVASAAQIAVPDSERPGSLALHPGASAYYEGSVRSFFDRYGDLFYIGIMGLSIFGSAFAALAGYANVNRPESYRDAVANLLQLLAQTRSAQFLSDLDHIDHQADAIFSAALSSISSKDFDHQQVTAFALTLDQLRHVIAERRIHLSQSRPRLADAAE